MEGMKVVLRTMVHGVVLAVLAGGASDVRAAIIAVYTNRADFDAAFAGAVRETWEGFRNNQIISDGATINGITYFSSAGNTVVTDAYATTSPRHGIGDNTVRLLDGGSTVSGFFGGGESITFTFSTPLLAFGIDINTSAPNSVGDYKATIDGNPSNSVVSYRDPFPGYSTGQFLGFLSNTPFSTVTITDARNWTYTLDTLRAVSATIIPLPPALWLLGGALLALLAVSRRKSAS
jgi:hypothetical protein